MIEGPTLWYIMRRRLALPPWRVVVVALAVVVAGSASLAGAAQRVSSALGVATPASAVNGAACSPVLYRVGLAMVPDHSRQLPAPSPAPVPGDTAACRRLRSLTPRGEPVTP